MRRLRSRVDCADSGVQCLGEMPTHWGLRRIKNVARVEMGQSPPNSTVNQDGYGEPFLQGNAEFGDHHPQPRYYCTKTTKFAEKDSILLSVRAPVGALNLSDRKYCIGRGLCAIHIDSIFCDLGYLWHTLQDQVKQLSAAATGSTYEAVAGDDVGNIKVPLPPLPEQRAIARFLDRETSRIDSLIEKKERLIELLREKRTALITHAVTKGLDPNVEMKDSGVEWLGEVPAHWEVEKAKRLFRERDERSEFGDEELLTVSHITGITPRAMKDVNMFMANSLVGYKMVHAGDMVINTMWAWMGAMGTAGSVGIVSPSYNVYETLGRYDRRFLDGLVRIPTFVTEATRYSKGIWSSRLRLYPDEFFEIHLPAPPLEEQRLIGEHINRETSKISTLRSKILEAIDRLREYRTALISAAVTGKIDVRNEVPG